MVLSKSLFYYSSTCLFILSNPVDTLLVAINAQGVFHRGENAVSPALVAAVVVRQRRPSSGQPNQLSGFGGYVIVIWLRRLLLRLYQL